MLSETTMQQLNRIVHLICLRGALMIQFVCDSDPFNMGSAECRLSPGCSFLLAGVQGRLRGPSVYSGGNPKRDFGQTHLSRRKSRCSARCPTIEEEGSSAARISTEKDCLNRQTVNAQKRHRPSWNPISFRHQAVEQMLSPEY
jgi:hypothetical protein